MDLTHPFTSPDVHESTEPTCAPRRGAGRAADERLILVAGSIAATVALLGFFGLASVVGPDAWVPLLVALVLVAVSLPIIWWLSDKPIDRRLRRILLVAFALKMLCTVPRYAMNEVAYDGAADAGMYHDGARTFRENVLDGRWNVDGSKLAGFPDETQFVGYVAGGLYLLIGATQMGGYLVFTWLSWLGLVCVFRAFRIGYPNAPPRLAALLIFLLPSTLYWPSSIGKDALMVLGIGLITLGLSRILVAERRGIGLIWLALGGALVTEIRAHLLLISLVGVAVALIARNANAVSGRTAVVTRAILLMALIPVLLLGLGRMDEVFGSPGDSSGAAIAAALAQTAGRTSTGGSSFETQPVSSPVDLPVAITNVLYRPFIFEARSVPALVTALEGTVLLMLTVVGLRWLWRIGPAMGSHPLAAFCGGYVLAFVFAFSNIGNAGILARQRVQMFPVLMVLVAAAAEHRRMSTLHAAPQAPTLSLAGSVPALVPDPRLVPVP